MNLPLYKQIYKSISEKIQRGELKQGDRIPSESELSDQFKVSRITSKKALDMLAQENLIERVQGKGSFVHQEKDPIPSGINKEPPTKDLLIGLVIPDFTDSYGAQLIKEIESNLAGIGANLLVKFTYDEIDKENRAIHELLKADVDGIIILPIHGEHYNPTILELVLKGYPIVFVDRYLRGIQASSVSTDNARAAQEATEYLLSQGHQHIAYITPPHEGTTALEDRMRGYLDAHTSKQIPMNPKNIFTTNVSELAMEPNQSIEFQAEIEKLKQFITGNPHITAFIGGQYLIASIVNKVIAMLNKRVPEDYSIVCFDSPKTLVGSPYFTHIAQRENEMAAKAVELLMALVWGEATILTKLNDYDFVEGLSTLPKR